MHKGHLLQIPFLKKSLETSIYWIKLIAPRVAGGLRSRCTKSTRFIHRLTNVTGIFCGIVKKPCILSRRFSKVVKSKIDLPTPKRWEFPVWKIEKKRCWERKCKIWGTCFEEGWDAMFFLTNAAIYCLHALKGIPARRNDHWPPKKTVPLKLSQPEEFLNQQIHIR